MDWKTLLADSHTALRTAVAGVGVDGWDLPTPCEKWTVTQVLQHAAGDQIGYAAAITGGPWPAEDPFAPSGHIDGDPAAYLAAALAASSAAYDTVEADAEAVPTPLPQGALPAWLAAGACALDAGVHAWDIAVATGQPSPLTPELAAPLLVAARSIVEPLRAYGAYAPALPAADGDDEVAALLRYLGRNYPECRENLRALDEQLTGLADAADIEFVAGDDGALAGLGAAVPGAVLGNQDLVTIFLRKLLWLRVLKLLSVLPMYTLRCRMVTLTKMVL